MMSKQADYQLLYQQALALFEGETDWIANASNLAALLYNGLADVNFAGFYRVQDGELILGPFQGQVACVHIAFGSGVCGTAAQTGKTQLVKDVHQFAGHIACDAASNSEIVVPIYKGDKLWGVLDIDSPKLARFDQEDQAGLERLAPLFLPGA
ncbi:GAF domain-containing protein [Limosilactobacillus fermentum]|uniref:GAF domain-containing protein n=1 Tax=Limosilactobacillus fermentum TaxID=1613 RepID=UPI000C233026|nr:GAF domain-containing protein [Limosilactobacillus fermentum]